MEILIIRKGLEAFEYKFEPFEWDSKRSKVIRSIRMQVRAIRKGLEAFEYKFEPFERDSNHLQIRTIRKGFEALKCKFEPLKGIQSIRLQIRTI